VELIGFSFKINTSQTVPVLATDNELLPVSLQKARLSSISFGVNTLNCLMRETSGRSFEPYVGSGMVDEKHR